MLGECVIASEIAWKISAFEFRTCCKLFNHGMVKAQLDTPHRNIRIVVALGIFKWVKRSAKESVKPNNVNDKEVRECMEGIRGPTWAGR